MPDGTGSERAASYRAPALDKGLEILELLAGESGGLTQSQIAQRLGRSVGEIFRVLNNLERRGYLLRSAESGAYSLSLRLFELAHRFPPTRRLLDVALPEMRRFAASCLQSCHLVVEESGSLLVIADAENPGPATYSIRVGARFELARRASSYVLTAFQPPDRFAQLVEATLGPGASGTARTWRGSAASSARPQDGSPAASGLPRTPRADERVTLPRRSVAAAAEMPGQPIPLRFSAWICRSAFLDGTRWLRQLIRIGFGA